MTLVCEWCYCVWGRGGHCVEVTAVSKCPVRARLAASVEDPSPLKRWDQDACQGWHHQESLPAPVQGAA